MKYLNELARQCHATSRDHGFWPVDYRAGADKIATPEQQYLLGHKIALIHSELSEALEDVRTGSVELTKENSGKMHGVPSELADVLIRTLELMHAMGTDIEAVVLEKMAYNRNRPRMHGKLS